MLTLFPIGLLALGALGAITFAFLYLRAEPRVRGRPLLLALRLGALGILLLLLFDPALPGEDPLAGGGSTPSRWVLMDPDPALGARTPEGTLWAEMLEAVARESPTGLGLSRLTGNEPVGVTPEALEAMGPAAISGDLGEGLVRLAEAGADSVVLLSPLRMPAAPLEEALSRAGIPVRVVRIGGTVRNAAVSELRFPLTARPDEPVRGEVVLAGEGGAPGDSVLLRVEVSGEDPAEAPRVVHEARHPLPALGAPRTLPLVLPPPGEGGTVRYRVEVVLEGDGFPADDERIHLLRIGESEGGIVLVSFLPDWEPRTLLPVLERASGLEGFGWLRVGSDRFLPLRSGAEGVEHGDGAAIAQRMRSAEILVIHGADGPPLEPIATSIAEHPRVIHLPAGPGGAALAGVSVGAALSGEWSVAPQLPSSALQGYLAGANLGGLPPLLDPFPPGGPPSGEVALEIRRGTGEGTTPALVLVEGPTGRGAVALARGFWRWGAREGEARQVYRSLWAGVVGWLLAYEGDADPGRIRPEHPVLRRGHPLPWVAFGLDGASLDIELRPGADATGEGPVLRRDRSEVEPGGRFHLPELPPGRYRYRAGVERPPPAAGTISEPSVGGFEVEGFQGALLRPPLDPEALDAIVARLPADLAPTAEGRPLRTNPIPWMLLLAFLCLEWIGRRRVGLR